MAYLAFGLGAAVAIFVLGSLSGLAIRKFTGHRQTVWAYALAAVGGVVIYGFGNANGGPWSLTPEALFYPFWAIVIAAIVLRKERRDSAR